MITIKQCTIQYTWQSWQICTNITAPADIRDQKRCPNGPNMPQPPCGPCLVSSPKAPTCTQWRWGSLPTTMEVDIWNPSPGVLEEQNIANPRHVAFTRHSAEIVHGWLSDDHNISQSSKNLQHSSIILILYDLMISIDIFKSHNVSFDLYILIYLDISCLISPRSYSWPPRPVWGSGDTHHDNDGPCREQRRGPQRRIGVFLQHAWNMSTY